MAPLFSELLAPIKSQFFSKPDPPPAVLTPMGKTPERRVFASNGALRYRRKVADNQQPEEPPVAVKQERKSPPPPSSIKSHRNTSRSPSTRRFRPKARASKQQQQPLLKQLLWKAKAVQPTQPTPKELQQQEEDEEAAFANEQRQARKLLASEAEALAKKRNKTLTAVEMGPSGESFVAESSSQETQSGSEDETVFLPYSSLPTAKWQVYKQQEDEETDGEETASPVVPSETVEGASPTKDQPQQDGLEKATATRRKQRQKYKLKQRQKRVAAKQQKRLQQQQKTVHENENERPRRIEEDAGSTQDDENAAVDIFHPPTNLASEMDAGVCRAVLSQLKEVAPFIVVGDVACPVVADHDEQPLASTPPSDKGQVGVLGSKVAIVDFRQRVIAMLDRSKETQMQYRESFVVEESGFDAVSSYDFFKHRFCEIQRSAGIVYY